MRIDDALGTGPVSERRRRAERFRARRRDLSLDIAGGFVLALFALVLGPGLGMLTLIGVPLLLILVFGPPLVRIVRRRRAGRAGAGVRPTRTWGEPARATAVRPGAGRSLIDGVSSSGARLRRAFGDGRRVQPRRRPRL